LPVLLLRSTDEAALAALADVRRLRGIGLPPGEEGLVFGMSNTIL